MNKYIPQRIAALEEYTPSEGEYRIRLDANENPVCRVPDHIYDKIREAVDGVSLNRYPDPCAKELIKAFCAYYGCREECVTAGCGSDELISLLVNMLLGDGDRMLVCKPDFSMYAFYASLANCEVITAGKDGDLGIDFDALAECAREKQVKAVFFSNPCNPTGRAYDRETILRFADSLDCVVVVDEAYMEFCRPGCSVLGDVGERENLIVLKTLSKAFGMAALRVGFAIAHPDIASSLKKIKSPYNLGAVSQAVGKTILGFPDYIKGHTAELIRGTKYLYDSLVSLGVHAYPTDTNFVLMDFDDDVTAGRIYGELKKRSIIIRNPDRRHLRVSCGTDEENERFIYEFTDIYNTRD